MDYKNKKIAIIGFGIEGHDAYRFFSKQGTEINVYDRSDPRDLKLQDLNIPDTNLHLGAEYLKDGLEKYDLIVRSAGVRPDLPEISDAIESGTILTSTISLFFDKFKGKIIGVTGTKGKGTTSTLIFEMLSKSGKDVELAGNIGKPVLSILDKNDMPDYVVLELSSFQLIDLNKSPHIAVVLNITLDHMDWHKDKKEYYKAKENIVTHQSEDDFAVINYDYDTSKKYQSLTDAKVKYFSKKHKVKGCYVKDHAILMNINEEVKIINTKELILRGEHNWENVTAASLASHICGVDVNTIRNVLSTFKGLEHRLEFVREVEGIKFYNDSFSTTIHTTIAAVDSFEEEITLILGGFDKGLDYKKLTRKLVEQENLKNILVIGDIGERYQTWLTKEKFSGKIFNMGYSQMEDIVKKAFEVTNNKGVVVLSPSTSSFDMFKSYKERGEKFKNAVNKL